MTTYSLTASSQVKSANAVTDIENHSGKKNRKKYAHANKDIDPELSDQNVEFDFYSREELLEKHYRSRIDKHNKNNNSKARRYETMDDFLASFEGKTVRGNKNNVRWSTVSQVTYIGDKESLGSLWSDLMDAGATVEELQQAYSDGYKEYVEKHNEAFPTLPIYHSDIHFDETTPHGHDAIVVMGHSKNGKASDSLNNALGEKYGYEKDNKEKMRLYRDENDALAFSSVTGALLKVGEAYGVSHKAEMIRTGQEFSLDVPNYKHFLDKFEALDAELDEREITLSGREAELEVRIVEVEKREAALAQQEADVTGEAARLKRRAEELEKSEKRLDATVKRSFDDGVYNTLHLLEGFAPSSSLVAVRDILRYPIVADFSKKMNLEGAGNIFDLRTTVLNEAIAERRKKIEASRKSKEQEEREQEKVDDGLDL